MNALMAVFVCICASGCQRNVYDRALRAGPRDIQLIAQFVHLYPKARNSISYLTGEAGQTTWHSAVGLYGRYALALDIPIRYDRGADRMVAQGKPTFTCAELESVQYDPKTREESVTGGDLSEEFGLEKWKSLVKANGDIAAIFDGIKKDQPVPGFDDYIKRNTE